MRTPASTGVSRFSRYPRIAIALATLLAVTAVAALAISGLARQKENSARHDNAPQIVALAPTLTPTTEQSLIPNPLSTAVLPTLPPADTATLTPKPLWDLESLAFNASVVAEAQIIGTEKRPDSYTFIFYVHDWYKNQHGVKGNIVRLTLDTTRNWDKLVYLPRNDTGSTDSYYGPFRFMLFLGGTPDNYFILGDTVGIFFLREGRSVEAGVGVEQYQEMPISRFKEELRAVLHIIPTPQPPTPTPLPTPADGKPISLLKEGDGYRVYPYRGIVSFGGVGMETWLGPSRLLIRWSSGKEPWEGKAYAADLQSGTLEEYIFPDQKWPPSYSSVPHPNGKRVLLMKGGNEVVWGVTLYDVVTKQEYTVFDSKPAIPQWAGADVHGKNSAGTPGNPNWLDEDFFLLAVGPGQNSQVMDPGLMTLLLINATSHKVRVLAKGVTDYSASFGAPVIYQIGGISGALMLLPPPYTGKPITLTPGGPWIRDWIASPDGSRVAWVEATAPPGDWSKHLPNACGPCESYGPKDPEPQVQAIAIWDAATQQVYRHKPEGLVWSLGSAFLIQQGVLRWRSDSSALLYAAHASTPARAALYSLTPGAQQPILLADHPWDGTVNLLGEGGEGSIYYYVTGKQYYASGDIVRRHPDGTLEVLHGYLTPNMWWVQPGKWLEVLGEGVVYVYDFTTGDTRHARFRSDSPSPGELDWAGIVGLVPLSPDGEWAAYAGTNSDPLAGPPQPLPDRGPEMLIVRVK